MQRWAYEENWGAQFGYISAGDEIVLGVPNLMYLEEPHRTAMRMVKIARANRIVALLNEHLAAPEDSRADVQEVKK